MHVMKLPRGAYGKVGDYEYREGDEVSRGVIIVTWCNVTEL